ncbi:MAG: CHASE2 domain-containing protein [Cyanobacteriota bacterium]|nr:CHASE2 domain-containing protein [Cyanobacteriota bacterium]
MARQKWKHRIARWRGLVAIAIATAAIVIAANALGLLQLLEWATLDTFFHLRPPEPVDSRIAIVTIDEPDIEHLGHWPMRDREMARLLKQIAVQQPLAIALDIYRDLPVEPGHQQLVEVFKSTPNLIGIEKVTGQTIAPPPILDQSGQTAPVDLILDADGKLRRALLGLETKQGEFKESLGATMALAYLQKRGISLEVLNPDRGLYQLGQATFVPLNGNEGGYIGKDGGGYQILLNYRGQLDRFLHLSLTDVLENRISPELLRDRLVFIGATTPSLKDIFQTPYSNSLSDFPQLTPGVVVHANLTSQIISAALDNRPLLFPWSRKVNWLWIGVWSALGAIGSQAVLFVPRFAKNRFLLGTLIYIILSGCLLYTGSYLAFLSGRTIPVFSPFLALAASAILTANFHKQYQLKTVNRRLEKAKEQLEDYSRTLELKVSQRTNELSEALEHLEVTQQELIQKEKTAALGQLVAGIAHEINSPLGAIHSSVGNITQFFDERLEQLPIFLQTLSLEQQKDFLALLHESAKTPLAYFSSREIRKIRRKLARELDDREIADSDRLADTLVEIGVIDNLERYQSLLETPNSQDILDTAYRLVSLRKSTRAIAKAGDRAAKIVFALKTYTRYERQGTKVEICIEQGIESVLSLYHNQLQQGIEVVRNYSKGLPPIQGYPDELNQVWINLIHNAIQAMDNRGTLEIEIDCSENSLHVSITDSGQGIPPEIQDQIFQPFFTTKPAGEGSGLGLDIARKIVEKHQGKLTFVSVPGRTTFQVCLPIA